METYNNIRQIYPSFRLSTILKSIESTIGASIPEPAEDIYRKIKNDIFMLGMQDDRYTLSTCIDIQNQYLIKSYDSTIDVPALGKKLRYIVYNLHRDVFEALKYIYLRENSTTFPFFNSYTSEYWHSQDELEEEEYTPELHSRIIELKPDFNLESVLKRLQLIYNYAQTPLTFEIPSSTNKVQFNGREILFETDEGNQLYPCNVQTYDVVISQLILQSTRTIPFLNGITTYHSTYTINV